MCTNMGRRGGAGGGNWGFSSSGLPQLTGTERQIDFANDIRQKQIQKYNQELQQFLQTTNMQEIGQYENTFNLAYLAGVSGEIRKSVRDKIQKTQENFSNERVDVAKQLRNENKKLRRYDAIDAAEKKISPKYAKEIKKAMQPLVDATVDKIQKIESAKWWIESGRYNSFKK